MGAIKAYHLSFLALLAAVSLGACANSNGGSNAGLSAPTASITGTRPPVRAAEDDAEPARPVPPDPYKSVQYRGGRDPVSGAAPGLDGEMPPPATPPGRAKKLTATPGRNIQPIAATVGRGQTVEVLPGDTLFSIASRSKVTVAALKLANNLNSDKIVPGQRLVLP